jgi:predicted O-linked N-acetylglucosamine transferase (SPINDLY family)
MAAITSIALGAAIAGTAAKGAQAISANQKAQSAKGDAHRAKNNLAELEASRQEIINPYEGIESVAGMATDVSGTLKNRMANIGVATQAAEMQIEQADIALANTLDTLAATGASAGGATALAQAAMQSKKGVSASIEKQEVANQRNAAQAEMRLDQAKMSEQLRLQGVSMSEAKRIQQAEAAGKDYTFKATETRELAGLDRAQAQVENAQATVAGYQQARDAGVAGTIGSLGNLATSVGGAMNAASTANAARAGFENQVDGINLNTPVDTSSGFTAPSLSTQMPSSGSNYGLTEFKF